MLLLPLRILYCYANKIDKNMPVSLKPVSLNENFIVNVLSYFYANPKSTRNEVDNLDLERSDVLRILIKHTIL